MNQEFRLALMASLVAIAMTTTLDATGYGMFSAFILVPLIPLFAKLGKISRAELGYVAGDYKTYLPSGVVPLFLIAALSALAWSLGAMDPTRDEWSRVIFAVTVNSLIGILLVAITEEGFFRGVLWSLLERSGQSDRQVLWTTTAVFVVWHLSAIFLAEDYAPALFQVPIYLVNATLLGLIWGLLRQQTGSIWPPAIYHSVWNGVVYQLYGFGLDSGDLGIEPTWIYGPEIGLAGIVLSGSVVVLMLPRSKPAIA